MAADSPPRGVWVSVGFFAVSGVLEVLIAAGELPRPLGFWPVWDALGRGLPHLVLAFGLWRRIAVCRTVAMVYCLAALLTYGAALGLALARAPLEFPLSVVLQSLYQIPSCALLLPYLKSREAADVFARPLFGR